MPPITSGANIENLERRVEEAQILIKRGQERLDKTEGDLVFAVGITSRFLEGNDKPKSDVGKAILATSDRAKYEAKRAKALLDEYDQLERETDALGDARESMAQLTNGGDASVQVIEAVSATEDTAGAQSRPSNEKDKSESAREAGELMLRDSLTRRRRVRPGRPT